MNNRQKVATLIALLLLSILFLKCTKEQQMCDCYTFSKYGGHQVNRTYTNVNCEDINRTEVLEEYKEFVYSDTPGTTYPLNIKYENVNCK